jgi:peptidoglycan/xylan/chitin deacetylase (PgdA/CDA1 family)
MRRHGLRIRLSMLKVLKQATLAVSKELGVFRVVGRSRWRQQRLLILCYHGLSLRDEHEWRPLFVTPAFFRRRMDIIARAGCHVLPLGQAVQMLSVGELPPKSVVITFDDGFHDFHREAFPVLLNRGFPATVYQTTYYSDHPFPIFNLILSYLTWRGRDVLLDGGAMGVPGLFDLSGSDGRDRAVSAFLDFARQRDYSPAQKDQLACRIARELGVDYAEILRLRMLHLMTAGQLAEIAGGGVDIQLHTHRHRTPIDEALFVREIRENRHWIASKVGTRPTHFCYPSGVHRREFLTWLRAEQVVSATTCDHGLVTRQCEPLLMPRLLDTMHVTQNDFEGWLAGVSSHLPHRRI